MYEKFLTKKLAFTLAEVLITLGVIGVVAALTIPGLMAHYKKIRTVTQLKESYSILQQAIKLSQEDNGESDSWDTSLSAHDFFQKYFANYLKWQKEYSLTELKTLAPRTYLNGTTYTGAMYDSAKSSHFLLINGSQISVASYGKSLMFAIDVNGLSKPNRIGIDTFQFVFTPEYGLLPWGDKGTDFNFPAEVFGTYKRKTVMGSNSYACNKTKMGQWCTALIIQDGWKISNDYPWK